MPILNPQQIQDDRVEKLKILAENLHASKVRGNDISSEYRSTLTTINDKVILIALGTLSLLITFLGILFSTNKDTSALEYKYILLALVAYLTSVILLLVSRWSGAIYIFNTVHKYYLQDLERHDKLQLKILESPGISVNRDTYEVYTPSEITENIRIYKDKLSDIKKGIKKNINTENTHDRLSKTLMLAAYLSLSVAYLFTIIFFIGVINILNKG